MADNKEDGEHIPMQERLSRLETHYESLDKRIGGLERNTDKILEFVSEARHKKPPSFSAILGAIATTGTIMAMVAAGAFFFVDSRVGAAVDATNKFMQTWETNGRLYVLEHKVKMLDEAVAWAPKFVQETKR